MSALLLFVIVFLAIGWAYHGAVLAGALWLWLVLTSGWLPWVIAHPIRAIICVAAYFLIGAVWSVVKWWFSETAAVRRIKESKHFSGVPYTPEETARRLHAEKTSVADSKGEIKLWIAIWPLNMVWTLIDDPVRRLVHRIADELTGVYQRITDHVWRAQ